MGTYIYSVRTAAVAVELDGTLVQVYPLSYLTRSASPGHNEKQYWHDECAFNRRLQAKAEATWTNRGVGSLEGILVVLCNKRPKDGDAVLRYAHSLPHCYDSESFGKTLGYIRKVGRKWTVAKAIYQGRVGTDRAGVFYVRESSPIFFSTAEAVAWAKANVRPGEVARLNESASEERKTAFERVAAPDSETINDVGETLLHGPYPCDLLAEQNVARAQAVDVLVSRGWVEIHAESYTGEGEKPYWHGRTYYRLTAHGLAKLAGAAQQSGVV